jgi:chemotaxis-related protein WspB
MLGLLVRIGETRFALDAREVVEVVPRVPLHPPPPGQPALAGLLFYRGQVVPVVDIKQLLLGTPCPQQLSTRILLARCAGRTPPLVGFIAEHVTEALRLELPGATAEAAPVLASAGGVTHLFDLATIATRALGPALPGLVAP